MILNNVLMNDKEFWKLNEKLIFEEWLKMIKLWFLICGMNLSKIKYDMPRKNLKTKNFKFNNQNYTSQKSQNHI